MMLGYVCVFMVTFGLSYGGLMQWHASEDTYNTKVSKMIMAKFGNLTARVEALKPDLQTCVASVNTTATNCLICLNTTDCNPDDSPIPQWLTDMSPTEWGPKLESKLGNLANDIANGAQTVYNKYGSVAVDGLMTGINAIGSIFTSLVNTIGNALQSAFNYMKNVFSSLWDSITGKRRRRSTIVAEAYGIREKRGVTFTQAQLDCMSKCPPCSPLTSGDDATIMRAICGDAVVNANQTLTSEINILNTFFQDWQNATSNLIKSVYADDTTYIIQTMTMLKGKTYVTYNVASENWKLSMWGQDPIYVQMADYMFKQYQS